jgi:cell division protease FtsH
LFFGSGNKDTIKYYQIISYFKKGEVLGFNLNLENRNLDLVVEHAKAHIADRQFKLPSTLLAEDPTNLELCAKQYEEIMDLFSKNVVTSVRLIADGVIRVSEIKKPAVIESIKYKVPDTGLFLKDIESYRNSIKSDYKHPSTFMMGSLEFIVSSVLPLVLIFFVFRYMTKGSIGQNIGGFKSKNIRYLDKGPKVLMSDVAALSEEKEEIEDLIQFLKNPNKFNEIGARIPSGVLLVGPPGTGKTLLARALAGEASVPFLFISGSAFVEMFVGVGASRVRDLFEQAKKHSPCIIFIDEIDAVGKRRESGSFGGHDERDQTLNQLLVEMDGFKPNSGVIVVAATNMSQMLDKALLRPGRFDRQIYIGYPDIKGREEILNVHARNKPLAPDVNLETVAKATIGFTGADLANLLNEAALLAAKNEKKAIRSKDIDDAIIRVIVGTEKKSKRVTASNRKSTAYHEAGHAICAYYCEDHDDVNMVSIIPTGGAGGFTLSMPKKDDMYRTDKAMFEDIVVAMGGKAAEKLEFNEFSTGASSDMRNATLNARSMVTIYGFNSELGHVVYDNSVLGIQGYMDPLSHSEETMKKIDEQIKKIIDAAYERAIEILTKNKAKLKKLAEYLIEHEKIDAAGFERMMRDGDSPAT